MNRRTHLITLITLVIIAFAVSIHAAPAPASRVKLHVASFDLSPAQLASMDKDTALTLFENSVEVIETLLYAQEGKQQARKEGRRLWTDPTTFRITMVDTDERIRAVSDFIRSLPQLRARAKDVIIPIKHLASDEMATQLQEVLGGRPGAATVAQTANQRTIRLRRGQETTFRDLTIRLRRVEENDADDDSDDSCELVLRTPTESQETTLDEFLSVFIGNYEIVADDIRPSGAQGDGSVRLTVRYIPPAGAAAAP